MASHLSVSLSESLQASLIIKHQEERRQQLLFKQPTRPRTRTASTIVTNKETHDLSKDIPLYQQCLLVTGFAGIEMCGAFSMVYTILFLEFVGVPTRFLTVEGLIAGVVSVLSLPIAGYFADRGSNLMIRKLNMTLITMTVNTLGFAGMAACSATKLNADPPSNHNGTVKDFISNATSHNYQHSPINQPRYYNDTEFHIPINHYNSLRLDSNQQVAESSSEHSSLKPFHVIAILSASFLDIGFCTGMALYRAFVLEASPPCLHNKLLIMATIFSSLGGLILCVCSTIDFATILGTAFNVDGTAATVLMLSCSVLTFTVITLVCTIITGYHIYQKYPSKPRQHILYVSKQRYNSESRDLKPRNSLRRKLLMRSNSVSESLIGGGENDGTEPLLSSVALDNQSYSAMSMTSVASGTESEPHRPHNYNIISDGIDIHQYQKILSPWEHSPSNVIHEGKVFEPPPTTNTMAMDDNDGHNEVKDDDDNNNQSDVEDNSQFCNSASDDDLIDNSIDDIDNENLNEDDYCDNDDDDDDDELLKDDNNNDEKLQGGGSEISNIYAAMRASYSTSVSMIYNSILGGNPNTRKPSFSGRMAAKPSGATSQESSSIWKSKRLIVLIISIFFTMGAVTSFGTYNGHTLTIGVYHGDPSAPEGTKAREDYNRGIRRGALGNLILYCGYSFICLMNKKIIDVVGEKIYYMLSQTACMAALITFILIKSSDTYFVASTVCGLYRGCAFTLGYIMVTKLVKEETSKPEKNIGQIMAVIGLLMPTMFVILSSMMGPLMAAFHSAWVPMVIGVTNGGLALLVFFVFLVI